MYIPKINVLHNRQEAVEFMRRFSFGTMVTAQEAGPVATHLPFLVESNGDQLVLRSHLAKANAQWKDLETQPILVIFTEPHAYISPSLYEKTLNVPTWNYLAVHAYGQGKLIQGEGAVIDLLEATIDQYEPAYQAQWETLPEAYKMGLANGLVAFEITVTDLQAKKKLSQNKTAKEQQNIIESLSESPHSNEQLIADYMKKEQR